MKLVGYLVKYPDRPEGERGQYYSYILAGNGLFVEAEGSLLAARIPVAECPVRGLAPLESRLALTYGGIPQRFWDLALDAFMGSPDKERYVAITGKAGYHFYVPEQERGEANVVYQMGEEVVLDLHSHAHMPAFFSPKDNTDEVGLKLYGVVGKLDATPVVRLRVGVYGYFKELTWNEVFDGTLAGAVEYGAKEVMDECDVLCDPAAHGVGLEDLGRWLRRDWWLRS